MQFSLNDEKELVIMFDNIFGTQTAEELAEEIKKGAKEIFIINIDLAKKVIQIKAVGNVAWLVVFGSIGIAVVAVLAAPAAPVAGPVAVPAGALALAGAAPAVVVLGMPVVITAVTIAVAAGGVGVLNKLREYEIVEKSDKGLLLRKK